MDRRDEKKSSEEAKLPDGRRVLNLKRQRPALGFEMADLTSWRAFVALVSRPEDPASLALFRIAFGLIMMVDILNERGMADADAEFGNEALCLFPLFDALRPLAVHWMILLYLVMFVGALGITLGFRYRLACACFVAPYWYFFMLDKTTWNNHSYLYGLIGTLLLFADANRCLSLDGLLDPSIRNAHVPLWNYGLVRFQVFIVYFFAGLKKTELDWVMGYSMTNLASHWVFQPFKLVFDNEQITLLVVHAGGLFIDLFSGFLLFFDSTRLLGTVLTSSFHLMNAQMFSIGMFPYTMLATTAIFYSNDWPKRLWSTVTRRPLAKDAEGRFLISKLSPHCIYSKSNADDDEGKKTKKTRTPSFYHKFFAVFTLIYIAEQCFLPYSHFITKGYNNWTNGLYGYSWDMMVHSWHTQHIKVHFVDKSTGETHYLNPRAWTNRKRWSSHGDMIYQYARCIQQKLKRHNYTDVELYMDVWRSMNHRFNQRQVDPRVDLLRAEWSPFRETSWMMPLLTELSDWRAKMKEIESQIRGENNYQEITFVADFNGLRLENYVSKDLNATVELLKGQVNLEVPAAPEQEPEPGREAKQGKAKKLDSDLVPKRNITLNVGDKMSIPSGTYHSIYTISAEPSSFVYVYVNETALVLDRLLNTFLTNMEDEYNRTLGRLGKTPMDEETRDELAVNLTLVENSKNFFRMLLNRTTSEEKEAEAYAGLQELFTAFNFNKTQIYKNFVDKFHTVHAHKVDKVSESLVAKAQRKLTSHWLRFKQSSKMVYWAAKSALTGESYSKLAANDKSARTTQL